MNLEKEISREVYLSWVEKANEASTAYYDFDDPIMADSDFDELMQKVKHYEFTHNYVAPDSPTQRVGGSTGKSSFAKVTHATPMLSLQDVFNKYDVENFVCNYPGQCFSVEEKIDGLSMSVTYKHGLLTMAETRGDGYVGEDITENAKFVRGIPHKLSPICGGGNIDELEVRVEVYMTVEQFERINAEREAMGKKLFANPRNAAAGLLRNHDTSVLRGGILQAFAFDLQRVEYFDTFEEEPLFSDKSHIANLYTLKSLGFSVINHEAVYGKELINRLHNAIDDIGNRRSRLPYWIDGAVIKLDNLELRKVLGATNKVPKWAIAYKYPAEEKETVVKDIILQTGRTGRVTPVAILDPVELGGTMVSKATLHNPEQIKRLKINVGDMVLVRKAAEIIPEIVSVTYMNKDNSDIYDVFAHNCPSCGGPIVPDVDEKGVASGAYCKNPGCPAQLERKFEFWASRDCMDIVGFGPAYIDKFISLGWLKNIPDIYKLKDHRAEMIELDGFGEKAVDNLLEAIEQSKTRNIDRLLKALGIPGVGRHIGKALAESQPGFYAIMTLPYNALLQYEGIGEISAKTMVEHFSKPEFLDMMVELANLGVNVKSLTYKNAENNSKLALSGKTFVITGTLPTMKREEAAKLIEDNGGKVSGSVSKKTDYLLAGEKAGSKLDKATALGIVIISEEDFKNMII
ncbi:MAG: NAD-dependent DNA ligase LigA [Bacteroidales bacterium]|nr:NAD-dependent DNA ligase LigA [Bacteroidales bacterium]